MNRLLTHKSIFNPEKEVIHIIGIGGIGMSGIAEILCNLGYKVQGSDVADNYNIQRLKSMNVKIFIGHNGENIKDASVIVKSTAIKDDNPEIIAAKEQKIMIIKRFEMLAEIMRFKTSIAISGTHGKTTTTSLMASMIEYGGLKPTVINGGIINNKETNAYLGEGDFLVVEADESDATFIKIPATVAVITNIDPEHLDFYGSFEEVKKAFRTFVKNVPFYGFAVLCIDHPEVAKIAEEISDRKIITYGLEHDADIKAVNIRKTDKGSIFDVEIKGNLSKDPYTIEDIELPIFGRHNILNSLSVIATAVKLGFEQQTIKNGFKSFQGVKRRFTKVGEVNGVSIIDDYAHHPAELRVTLNTARSVVGEGKIIAIFQPHRYSRVKDLFEDFANSFGNADHLLISDIYSAGESPIEGINKDTLRNKVIESNSKIDVMTIDDPEHIADIIKKLASPKDMVIFLGAGTVTYWAYKLPDQLAKIIS